MEVNFYIDMDVINILPAIVFSTFEGERVLSFSWLGLNMDIDFWGGDYYDADNRD